MMVAARNEGASPSQSADVVLEFRKVVRRFGASTAVDAVDLQVHRGEFLTLLGPSGCGKTTMLRLMAGFEQPDGGDVLLEGRSVNGVAPYHRTIGMVFQNYALFPHLSVKGNLAFGLRMRGRPRHEITDKVARALTQVGLSAYGERAVHQLSGGQRQRVALARALIVRPSVLLLDEPLAALDLSMRRQMQAELKQIQRKSGTTFIFVTHDQEEAMSMSDRIAVCNGGRIEQIGAPEEIYLSPANHLVASLVGEANVLKARIDDRGISLDQIGGFMSGRPGQPGPLDIVVRPENVRFHAESDPADAVVDGVIEDVSFVGAAVGYSVRCGEGVIRMRSPFDRGSPVRSLGEKVRVAWSARDCTFLKPSR